MAPGRIVTSVLDNLIEDNSGDEAFAPPAKRRRVEEYSVAATEPSQEQPITEQTTTIPPHPLDIKPSGNEYTATINLRDSAGYFARLPHELVNNVLERLRAADLVALGSTCKYMYGFARQDELWKSIVLDSPSTNLQWYGTWRSTHLSITPERQSRVSCTGLYSDLLHRPHFCAHAPLNPYASNIPSANAITRLPDMSEAEFTAEWIEQPFILTDPVKQWPIYKEWDMKTLLSRYGDTVFREEAVDWPLKTYTSYMRNNTDDNPLYLFDHAFAEKMHIHVDDEAFSLLPSTTTTTSNLPIAYTPPTPFRTDLFTLLPPHRPHHRWLIIGPARSGSTFHRDPNGTCAWNAILRGRKYWLLFPPGLIPPGIFVSDDEAEVTAPIGVTEWLTGGWWEETRKMMRRPEGRGIREGVCEEGEVLYVPSGWFHFVVNLEESVAVTQNFVPRERLVDVLGFLRDRKDQVTGFSEEVEDPFGLFVERLRGWDERALGKALGEVERRARERKIATAERERGSKWEKLVKGDAGGDEGTGGGGGGFSFGFGGDDDDDVEVP